jgi:hypothetical protein
MDSSLLRQLGWEPAIEFRRGLHTAYADFIESHGLERARAMTAG